MASNMLNVIAKGQSHTRPPLFDGTNYSTWKNRMKEFLMAIDFDLWFIVSIGPSTPIKDLDSITDPKELLEISADDKKIMSMNARAKNILSCALIREQYNRVDSSDVRAKRNIAFNSSHDTDLGNLEDMDDEKVEEELAMITKRFRQLSNFKRRFRNDRSNKRG
ncbi:hypothetical protein CDL12_04475 [Handroanthus impetiginosus]|uniref:Uncharacterized protein n=1 Tax=Handroanthus impetiginosus TaxID=429701 RepID=A0A2G9HZ78_9LAMI|nr:hypothetical protein CDL12_04475 [Handroanthus impetiginosus]